MFQFKYNASGQGRREARARRTYSIARNIKGGYIQGLNTMDIPLHSERIKKGKVNKDLYFERDGPEWKQSNRLVTIKPRASAAAQSPRFPATISICRILGD